MAQNDALANEPVQVFPEDESLTADETSKVIPIRPDVTTIQTTAEQQIAAVQRRVELQSARSWPGDQQIASWWT